MREQSCFCQFKPINIVFFFLPFSLPLMSSLGLGLRLGLGLGLALGLGFLKLPIVHNRV